MKFQGEITHLFFLQKEVLKSKKIKVPKLFLFPIPRKGFYLYKHYVQEVINVELSLYKN